MRKRIIISGLVTVAILLFLFLKADIPTFIEMQRDMYSAYLAKCVDVRTGVLDMVRAKDLWQGLEPVLSAAISRAQQTAIGKVTPTSFGFNGTQSQSGSLVKPATSMSEAMDVVIHPDESHRELI